MAEDKDPKGSFEDYFDKFAAAKEGDTAAVAGEGEGKETAATLEKDEADVDAAATAAAETEGQAAAASKDGAAEKTEGTGKAPPEIDWSTATPEQKAAFETAATELADLRHQNSSHQGRFAALTRIKDLSGKLARLANTGADSSAVQGQVTNYLSSEKFKKFKDENPEMAEPFEALAATFADVTGKLAKSMDGAQAETRAEILAEQADYVVEQHPEYAEIIGAPPDNTAEGKAKGLAQARKFGEWVMSQPTWVRNVVAYNGKHVINGDDVVEVVDRYKRQHPDEFVSAQGNGEDREAAEGGDANGQSSTSPDDVLRGRRKVAGAAPGTKGAGVGSGPPDDFDKAFEFFSAEKDRAKQRRSA